MRLFPGSEEQEDQLCARRWRPASWARSTQRSSLNRRQSHIDDLFADTFWDALLWDTPHHLNDVSRNPRNQSVEHLFNLSLLRTPMQDGHLHIHRLTLELRTRKNRNIDVQKKEALAQQKATEKPDDLVHCSFSPRCSLFCCFTHSAAVSSVTSKGVFLRIERFSPFRRGLQVIIWEQGHTSLHADIDPRVPAVTVLARKHRRHSDRRFVVSQPRTHPSFTPPSSAACSDDVATRLDFNKWSHKQATHVSRNPLVLRGQGISQLCSHLREQRHCENEAL